MYSKSLNIFLIKGPYFYTISSIFITYFLTAETTGKQRYKGLVDSENTFFGEQV